MRTRLVSMGRMAVWLRMRRTSGGHERADEPGAVRGGDDRRYSDIGGRRLEWNLHRPSRHGGAMGHDLVGRMAILRAAAH
eukprot:11687252-Heterocapsa_arctica.AAC.1